MIKIRHPNIDLIEKTAKFLGPLVDEIVFIGGCATGLLINDPAAAPVRPTIDVDVLVEVSSLVDYHLLSDKVREGGFSEDSTPGAPICRWMKDNILLDVIPTNVEILGFGNQWHEPAFSRATSFRLPSGMMIRILPAPYFLATKLAAFDGRGQYDGIL